MNVAILMNGAIARVSGKFERLGQLYRDGAYVNYKAIYNSIDRHIIQTNKNCTFDFFMHGWNYDIEKELIDLYNPLQYCLENNVIYESEITQKLDKFDSAPHQFALCSRWLSIKKVSDLFEKYVHDNSKTYDLVILYRPDIMLWKDMVLSNYTKESITANSKNVMHNYGGDFHWVMNPNTLEKFKMRYELDSPPHGWNVESHTNTRGWMKYVNTEFSIPIDMDDIEAGIHQAPIRYINCDPGVCHTPVKQGSVTHDQLYSYGFTKEEIDSYTNIF
jgi:hypothetical protein